LNNAHSRPREQKGNFTAEGAFKKSIIAARARKCRGKFGVAKRADQRDDAAQNPNRQKHRIAASVAGNQRRETENSRTDDDADYQRHGIEHTECGFRLSGRSSLRIIRDSTPVLRLHYVLYLIIDFLLPQFCGSNFETFLLPDKRWETSNIFVITGKIYSEKFYQMFTDKTFLSV